MVTVLWVGCCLMAALGLLVVLGARDPHPQVPVRRRGACPLAASLAEAGLASVRPSTLRYVTVAASMVAGLVVAALSGVLILGVAAGAAVAMAPRRYLEARRLRRRAEMRGAWPDAIAHIVASVRAGDTVAASVAALAARGPEALRPSAATFETDYRTCGDLVGALDRLADEVADPVADRVCAVLGLAARCGGSQVTAVLGRLEAAIRADLSLRREVESRQAWVLSSARAAAAAPWVVLALFAARSGGLAAYGTSTGAVVLVSGAVLTLAGYRIMRRVGRLPEEARLR